MYYRTFWDLPKDYIFSFFNYYFRLIYIIFRSEFIKKMSKQWLVFSCMKKFKTKFDTALGDPGFCLCCILASEHGIQTKLMQDNIGTKYLVFFIKKNLRSEIAEKKRFFIAPSPSLFLVFDIPFFRISS